MQEAFKSSDFPSLLVGLRSPDDAAVWKLDNQRGLVLTTDFFTPVVDDARDFGRIAAANSLSDVYAMGGTPFLALNIAALPADLDLEICMQIFQGGVEIAREAGIAVAGGHTIQDKEPKYGLVVAGFVQLDEMITKSGAKPGDQLYLTKPLGFGTITTALKRQLARNEDVEEAVRWMTHLNRSASQAAIKCGVRSGTDITGYAFLGHSLEMSQASQVAFRVEFDRLPVLENALRYAREFVFPGGAFDNRIAFGKEVNFIKELPEYLQMILFDPQTSGGLLLSVPDEKTGEFENLMKTGNEQAWHIGEVIEGRGITII
jgi:selenide,water dikinase